MPTLQVKHINDAEYVELQHCRALNPQLHGHRGSFPGPGTPGMAMAMPDGGGGGGGQQPKMRGKVKNWQDLKGFGFIIPNPECGLDPEKELFVHRSDLLGMNGARQSLAPQQEVGSTSTSVPACFTACLNTAHGMDSVVILPHAVLKCVLRAIR